MDRSDSRRWTQSLNRCSQRCALLEVTALRRVCEPLVGIRHRTRSWKVIRLQLGDLKSRRRNELIDLAIEVAAAPYFSPYRCEPVLPRHDTRIGGTAMLDKKKTPLRLENPPHLRKSLRRVRNRTQSPGHNDGVDALIGKRQRIFGRLRQEFHLGASCCLLPPCHLLECKGRLHAVHALDLRGIERKVQAGPNANFQNFSASSRNPHLAQTCRVPVLHRQINYVRQHPSRVETHHVPLATDSPRSR